ncbi:rod shape-determining protein MreC [Segatella salivae]|jgi:putative cell shape-determining protein mreC|uniref:rod shape-determining protein MreC n=1 Tax=Segatella salivae TaxID=228604 RepID=UPI001C5EF07F|nr:rod shape-determining protein MreC [Segatella salivae]MBF1523838.1 rod shape-determining protein MreC [Segatella salivae]MBF1527612.1 rod shape-determining protein MreC [Segatella salivae]MBF1534386.1 rod shape-determining protein MreC [Segatella salivae]MBF1538009.1 rod shape-determining protein MreC [Segatella salivae]MBF1540277.1 rod shape-determining protein MreC [Segatella salivae]
MRNLLDFLVKYNYWFLFLFLEAVSFVLLFQFNSYQGSVWFSSANAVTGKLYETSSEIESYFQLSKINSELTQRNLYLEQRLHKLEKQIGDSAADSTMEKSLLVKSLQPYRLIPAKVISMTAGRLDNLITINKGEVDGIKKDMGVVCGTGVVGIVYLTSKHYSIVIPILNSQSNISCVIQGRGYFGYLHWTGGDVSQAYVDDVPRHAHFRLYDNVVTSGYSSVFPAGIIVGKILHVYNSADQMSYRLRVKLSTDFGKLRDVCVVDNSALSEQIDILRAAQDSIRTKESGKAN